MAEGNGRPVFQIGRKGIRLVAFGEGKPFEVDVVKAHNEWITIDRSFRNEKMEIPTERQGEHDRALYLFVKSLTETSGCPVENLSLAEAMEFRKFLYEEVDGLSDFFVPKSRKEPSSPESSAQVRFST